jgi:hypothetical protein
MEAEEQRFSTAPSSAFFKNIPGVSFLPFTALK